MYVCVSENWREKKEKKEQGAVGRDVLLLSGSLGGKSFLASAVVTRAALGTSRARRRDLQGASSLPSPEVAPRRRHCPRQLWGGQDCGFLFSRPRPCHPEGASSVCLLLGGGSESGLLSTRPLVPTPSHRPISSPQPHSFFLSSFQFGLKTQLQAHPRAHHGAEGGGRGRSGAPGGVVPR